MPKLGAEYRNTDPKRDSTRQGARMLFLDKIRELEPRVVDELKNVVLPLYSAAWRATAPPSRVVEPSKPYGAPIEVQGGPAWSGWRFERGQWDAVEGCSVEIREFHRALMSWAERWNLAEAWVLDCALRNLGIWRLQQANGMEPDGFVGPQFVAIAETKPFDFEYRGWAPELETWSDYKQGRDAKYREYERAYKRKQMEAAEREGFQKSRAIRAGGAGAKIKDTEPDFVEDRMSRRSTEPTRHFEWLVRYHVGCQPCNGIADDYGVDQRTVRRAITEVATLIGVTPRLE